MYQDTLRKGVNATHLADLHRFLREIDLVDADLIDPEHTFSIDIPGAVQRVVQNPAKVHKAAIADYSLPNALIAAAVRDCFLCMTDLLQILSGCIQRHNIQLGFESTSIQAW